MKKIILFIGIMLLINSTVWAAEGAITRFGNWLDGTEKTCTACPTCPIGSEGVICPDTPVEDVKRAPYEIGIRSDIFVTPTGGPAQFHIDNFTLQFKHNYSRVFNVYASYSSATIEKTEYDNSLYDKTWHYQTIVAGIGWYIHPIFELFVGIGKIDAQNSEGSEELGIVLERGLRAHWALNNLGYKINIALISREIPLADEGVDINRSPAVATHTSISVGIDIPIGW